MSVPTPLTIALVVIAKNKEDIITRMLDSTQGVFDYYVLQDTGSTDQTVEIFNDWCVRHNKPYKSSKKYVGKDYRQVLVHNVPTLADFAAARNDSFDMARTFNPDYFFWMDTDDQLLNPHMLRKVAEFMNEKGIHLGFMEYAYSKTDDGRKPIRQERERLIDARISGRWKNRVHEAFYCDEPAVIQSFSDVQIDHLRTPDESIATDRRNHLIMTQELEEVGIDKIDESVLGNLAFDHWEHKEFSKAIKYYKAWLKRQSGKPITDATYSVLLKVARAYLFSNKVEQGIVYGIKALRLRQDYPDAHLLLSEAYASIGQWDDAVRHADTVLGMGKPQTIEPINELEYDVIPLRIKLQALLAQNRLDDAIQVMNKMVEVWPRGEYKLERFELLHTQDKKKAIDGLYNLMRYMQNTNQASYFDRLRSAIPLDLRDDELVRRLIGEMTYDQRRKSAPVRLPEKKIIVFYAGGHYEAWDGQSDQERGIGGSEGMCIQMARELAKLGHKVFVYNECGKSHGKVFDGVTYYDHRHWNVDIICDVFIALRRPDVFGQKIRASKQYLWLHDTEYGNVPLVNMYAPDNVFVLSEAHKSIIKQNHGIADDRIFYQTRNGYNQYALDWADKNAGKRNPYQLVYGSSYDRGLDNLLKLWPYIKAEVPEATLKIFYGWDTYDAMMQSRAQTPHGQWMARYKEEILTLIAQSEGVQELGRVSQPELYKQFAESAIWIYPTKFYEISCITAMQAQAMGAVPVCTPYAALKETVHTRFGMKVELDKIAAATIHLLKNQDELQDRSKKLMKWSRKAFNMAALAKEWDLFMSK